MTNTNPFASYTLAIADSYEKVQTGLIEAQKRPSKRVYSSMDALLRECFFLGATRYGTNFIC